MNEKENWRKEKEEKWRRKYRKQFKNKAEKYKSKRNGFVL